MSFYQFDIVTITHGLGNQMSQYAFYLAKKQTRKNTWAINLCDTGEHYGYELGRIFNVKIEGFLNRFFYYIYRAWNGRPFFHKLVAPLVSVQYEQKNYDYLPDYFKSGKKLFNFYFGGWHSEKYFLRARNEVLETFQFKNTSDDTLSQVNRSLKKRIVSDLSSVSLHVRRGDYLKRTDTHYKFDGICTPEYYQKAINYIREKVSSPHFYVFSDDIAWCKEIFGSIDFTYIDNNKGTNSYLDMYLMSLCHHHINANSTFSWWGAWLSQKEDSLIISPSEFIRDTITKDIYPAHWIKIR